MTRDQQQELKTILASLLDYAREESIDDRFKVLLYRAQTIVDTFCEQAETTHQGTSKTG